MFDTLSPCSETVPLWQALILGAGDACIEISVPSILTLLLPFIMFVVAAQWAVKRMLFGPRTARGGPARTADTGVDGLKKGQRRATGRWSDPAG